MALTAFAPMARFWKPTPRDPDHRKSAPITRPVSTSVTQTSPANSSNQVQNPTTTTTPIPTPAPTSTSTQTHPPTLTPSTPPVSTASTKYSLHTGIIATVFLVGEPQGGGSSEDNALSAWDDEWQKNYGGFDDPQNRNGYYPVGFTPKENPFYLDLPYNDFNDNGTPKSNRTTVVPWASEKSNWGDRESMMKNRWVKLTRNGVVCYGQIEDAGPYEYNDYNYVFGTADPRPKSKTANNAGLDVSPALRDCLEFNGWNNALNKVDWQFVDQKDVPNGPWKEIITTSQINWP